MNDHTAAQLIRTQPKLENTDKRIAAGSVALASAAMAVDHLLGDDPGLEDLPMFLIASALIVGLAALLFGRVIPAARASAEPVTRAERDGLIASVVAVVPGIATIWLGLPFVLAGAGLALGLAATQERTSWRAVAAIVIGAVVLIGATAAYTAQAIDKLA
jgi:hypothetical protein